MSILSAMWRTPAPAPITKQQHNATTPVWRFLTLGGAQVVVNDTGREGTEQTWTWACLGCDEGTPYGSFRDNARRIANRHAAECRAMPKPDAEQR